MQVNPNQRSDKIIVNGEDENRQKQISCTLAQKKTRPLTIGETTRAFKRPRKKPANVKAHLAKLVPKLFPRFNSL